MKLSAHLRRSVLAGLAVLGGGCASSPAPKQPAPALEKSEPERPPAKPAPEEPDGLEVQGTLGTVKAEDVEQVFKGRFSAMVDCVKASKTKFRFLGGAVDVKVKLDAKGAPKQSFLQSSTLGHREAEACIEKIVAELRFSPPKGGKEAEFNYPVDFGSTAQVASWDGARVETKMAAFRPHVRECKRRAPGGLPPGIALTVYIGPGGKVLSAGVAAEAPVPAPIADCLAEKARLLRLVDPLGQVAKATVAVRE